MTKMTKNLAWKKGIGLAAATFALAALFIAPARAQFDNDEVRNVTLDPAFHHLNIKDPIEFVPFPMVDFQTGEPVERDAVLQLPNGEQVTAGEFYDVLNRVESDLCAIGHSLRIPEDEPFLDSNVDPALLEAQVAAMQETNRRLKEDDGDGGPGGQTPGIYREKHWKYEFGQKQQLYAYIQGQFRLIGTSNSITATGNASAGAAALGAEFELAKANAYGSYERGTGKWKASLSVNVFGQSLVDFNKEGQARYTVGDTYRKTYRKSAKYNFQLGPIPGEAEFGFVGEVGVSWMVDLVPIKATAEVKPFVHSKAWARAGIGRSFDLGPIAIGVGLGIRGDLVVANYDGTLRGVLELWYESANRFYFDQDYSYTHSFDFLSGEISLYAYLNYVIGKAEWSQRLFAWTGYKETKEVFHFTRRNYFP